MEVQDQIEEVESNEENLETEASQDVDTDGATDNPVDSDTDDSKLKYEPNHKYTFMDEEREFDDKIKGFIKTKEDEDLFRDMVTAQQAHAKYKEFGSIRDIESKFEKFSQYENTFKEYNDLNSEIKTLGKMIGSDDPKGFEQFRQHLGINKEQVLQWAINEAKAMQEPEFGNQLHQQYNQHIQNFNLQTQNELMQNSIREQKVSEVFEILDRGLENRSDVVQAYDNLVGTPGSFRQAVIDHAVMVSQSQKRELSPDEAIEAVAAKFGGLVTKSVGTQDPVQTPQTLVKSNPEQTVVIRQDKNVIPNLRSGNQSPAKPKLNSLDALRNHAKTL